jgi:hypothetical protein
VYNKGRAAATGLRLEPLRALDGRPLPEEGALGSYRVSRIDQGGRSGFVVPIDRERDLLLRGAPTSSTDFEARLSWVDGNGERQEIVPIKDGFRYQSDDPPP